MDLKDGSLNKSEDPAERRIDWRNMAIIFVLGCVLYFSFLGSMSLWDTDEALYTQIAREMGFSGDFITTRWNFSPWFCHPPLYFWLTNLSALVFGWCEFSARFFSAFFGVLTLLSVYSLGKLLSGKKAGFLSALIMAVTLQIWLQSRMAILDMPFLFFIIVSVLLSVKAVRENRKVLFFWFWITAGLAVITKGPVGAIMPFLYYCLYMVAEKRWREIPRIFASLGFPLFFFIAMPWYMAMIQIHGRPFLEQAFGYFFLKRIYAPVMNQDGSWYYYIPFFVAGFLPWSAFIPATFYYLGKNYKTGWGRFLLGWIVLTFLMFTLAGTKRPNYILFIYPPLSIALGGLFNEIFEGRGYKKSSLASFLAFSISTLCVIATFIFMAEKLYPQYYSQYAGNLVYLGVPMLAGGIVILIQSFRNRKSAFYTILVMTTVIYFVLLSYIPLVESLKPEREMAEIVKRMWTPGDYMALRGNFGRQFSMIYYTFRGEPALLYHSEEDLIKGVHESKTLYIIEHRKNYDGFREKITVPVTVIKEKGGLILFRTVGETKQKGSI